MKKKISAGIAVAFLVLVSQIQVFAKPIDKICVTQFPSTSFKIQESGDDVIVEVINHNGPQYMPIWDGLVVPNDLEVISKAAKTMMILGDYISIKWKKSACENETLISCVGQAEEFMIGNTKIRPWALTESFKTEEIAWYTFKETGFVLNLDIDGKSHRISMNYYDGDCGTHANLTPETQKKLTILSKVQKQHSP